MFIKTLQKMLKKDLAHQIVKQVDCYEWVKSLMELTENKFEGEIMTKIVGPRLKVHSTKVFDR